MNTGDEIEVEAEALAFGGGGSVAHAPDGRVVFVPFLAPGDRAKVRLTEVKAAWARGRAVSLVAGGPDRVSPPCPVFGECGGCQWQHVSLKAQRAAKERIVRRFLEPSGFAGAVEALRGSGDGYGYRNRLVLPVRAGRDGLRAGFFRADSHEIVDAPTCLVQSRAMWEAAEAALVLAGRAGVHGYNERRDAGVLRHLVVRESSSGDLGVVYVTATGSFDAGEVIARELVRVLPRVAAVGWNANPGRTNVVMGPETRVLAGAGWLTERVNGLELRVSLPAFFQANHGVLGSMAALVAEWTRGIGGGILDLYSGVGVLGLTAAVSSGAEWVAGIEESPAAVGDARHNAERVAGTGTGGFRHEWHTGDAGELVGGVAERLGVPACVIADPPRKGLSPPVLAAIAGLRSPLLIYISCDPATFARDLGGLVAAGYRPETVVPLDMFPQTWHIELAARLRMEA